MTEQPATSSRLSNPQFKLRILLVLGFTACKVDAAAPALTTIAKRIPFEAGATFPATPPLELRGGGQIGVKASDCGACHRDNYEEWRESTHAYAMDDPQYFAEISKPGAPRWLCLNCHAPNQNQREMIVGPDTQLVDSPIDVSNIETIPNPSFDPKMRAEGVTCATCHVRVDGARSVVVASARSGRAPHPVVVRPEALNNVCLRCHDPGPGLITPNFLCWFESHREGRASGVEQTCVDCHMPEVERSLVGASPPRRTRKHFWTGGGVPKTFDGYDQLLARGYTPGGRLRAELDGTRLIVTLRNENAGHHLTSGDPERFIGVEVLVEAGGQTRVLDRRRLGQRWDWGSTDPIRLARRVSDTRVPAGEARTWTLDVPPEAEHIRVRAAHVRLTPENAQHMKSTRIPAEVSEMAPSATSALPHLEEHYPLMTWFAEEVYSKTSRRWRTTPLEALLDRSKGLRGRALETYPRFEDRTEAPEN